MARVLRMLALAVVVGCLSGVPGIAAASDHPRVGPNQGFRALVNGQNGYADPAVITMACAGPLQPGQTGHPVAGQTLTALLGAPSVLGGFTGGSATSIGAFFGAPPPSISARRGYVNLKRYGVAKPIPTSLTLPCSGTGHVFFVPLPMSPPTSHSIAVPVTFVGQP